MNMWTNSAIVVTHESATRHFRAGLCKGTLSVIVEVFGNFVHSLIFSNRGGTA